MQTLDAWWCAREVKGDEWGGEMRTDKIPQCHRCSWQLSGSAWRLAGLLNTLEQHSCVYQEAWLKQSTKGSISQQVTSSNWGLHFSQMDKAALEVVFPECDYRLTGKYAKLFCSSVAAGGCLRLRAQFSPSSQYFFLELTNGFFLI